MSSVHLWKDISTTVQTLLQSTTTIILGLAAFIAAFTTLLVNWTKLRKFVRKHFGAKPIPRKSPAPQLAKSSVRSAISRPARRDVSEILVWTEEILDPTHSAYPGRKHVQAALLAITKLIDIAYDLKLADERTIRSAKPYAKQLAFLGDLARAVSGLRTQATNLDNSLQKLELAWQRDDPRAIMFFYLDPFAFIEFQRSPNHMLETFVQQGERIAAALRTAGYEVERTPHPWDRRRPFRYTLAPARDAIPVQIIDERRRDFQTNERGESNYDNR